MSLMDSVGASDCRTGVDTDHRQTVGLDRTRPIGEIERTRFECAQRQGLQRLEQFRTHVGHEVNRRSGILEERNAHLFFRS